MKKAYKQSGRSMIEMLGVLAIVGVLSAGGIGGYSMAMQSYKTQLFIDRVRLISIMVHNACKGNYAGISRDTMIETGKLKNDDLKNPFGGNFDATEYSSTTFLYLNGVVQYDR